jgi:hypothetical protein
LIHELPDDGHAILVTPADDAEILRACHSYGGCKGGDPNCATAHRVRLRKVLYGRLPERE